MASFRDQTKPRCEGRVFYRGAVFGGSRRCLNNGTIQPDGRTLCRQHAMSKIERYLNRPGYKNGIKLCVAALFAWYFISAGTQYGPFRFLADCERVRAWSAAWNPSPCWLG